jgi:hypothetical protein
MMDTNQFSLHAKQGCKLVKNDSLPFTGTQTFDDCNFTYEVSEVLALSNDIRD